MLCWMKETSHKRVYISICILTYTKRKNWSWCSSTLTFKNFLLFVYMNWLFSSVWPRPPLCFSVSTTLQQYWLSFSLRNVLDSFLQMLFFKWSFFFWPNLTLRLRWNIASSVEASLTPHFSLDWVIPQLYTHNLLYFSSVSI